jgi:hypothetical protein
VQRNLIHWGVNRRMGITVALLFNYSEKCRQNQSFKVCPLLNNFNFNAIYVLKCVTKFCPGIPLVYLVRSLHPNIETHP